MAASSSSSGCAASSIASRSWVREIRAFRWWSAAGAAIVVMQAGLGALVVRSGLHATLVTAHYLTALGLVAVTSGLAAGTYVAGRPRATGKQWGIARAS